MTREEWVRVGEYCLQLQGKRGNFRAVEIANVGRTRRHWRTGAVVQLEAPPPPAMRWAITLRDEVLEWVRAFAGNAPVHINSWYRDPVYNASIQGAAPRSLHLEGCAADIVKAGWEPRRLALTLHKHFPRPNILGIGLYNSFVHVDIRGLMGRPAPARFGSVPNWWE